jgi:hypothetical protein
MRKTKRCPIASRMLELSFGYVAVRKRGVVTTAYSCHNGKRRWIIPLGMDL